MRYTSMKINMNNIMSEMSKMIQLPTEVYTMIACPGLL